LVVATGVATGLAALLLFSVAEGDQVKLLPFGPVGEPPSGVLPPTHKVTSDPAFAAGSGTMFTLTLTGWLTQPNALVAFTSTDPAPDAPQFTVMVLVPCPLAIVPPFTVHANVAPGMAGVV
jgi:hypothetical protein